MAAAWLAAVACCCMYMVGCDPDCAGGRVPSGGHCCWPEQTWSKAREGCQGAPQCPDGTVAAGGGCTGPAPACDSDMVGIGDAWFYMGSDLGGFGLKGSKLTETHVEAFCIDRTEVTVAAYRSCVEAGKCTKPHANSDGSADSGGNCNQLLEARSGLPVNCITIAQAQAYCGFRGRRLPTEPEWELAARGMDGRRLPWGDSPPTAKHGNFGGAEFLLDGMYDDDGKDPWRHTGPVDQLGKDVSPFGVMGMASNVSEWVQPARSRGPAPTGNSEFNRPVRGGHYSAMNPAVVDSRVVYFNVEQYVGSVGARCAKR